DQRELSFMREAPAVIPTCKSRGGAPSILVEYQKLRPDKTLHALAIMAFAIINAGCDRASLEARKRITPEYDKTTGKLQLLKYDANGDGITDTWSYMDGARVVRIEIDKDQDGKIDRWEYYGPNQTLEKVG